MGWGWGWLWLWGGGKLDDDENVLNLEIVDIARYYAGHFSQQTLDVDGKTNGMILTKSGF